MLRPYNIGLGSFTCVKCGKGARKYYQPRGSHKPYCSSCINGVVGSDVPEAELSVPIWLIALADKYVDFRLSQSQVTGQPLESHFFAYNFFNFEVGAKIDLPNADNCKINGKPVSRYWLYAVENHIDNRRFLIDENANKHIRDDIMCPVCIKRMYYTGGITPDSREQGFTPYHCLSARDVCVASRDKYLYGYFRNQGVLKRLESIKGYR